MGNNLLDSGDPRPDDPIAALRWTLARRWIAVLLTVFGDESHDEKTERVFTVTGVIGRQSEWDALEIAWKDRTNGRTFHASDCDTNQGEYRCTPNAENKQLYKDLTQLIVRSGLFGYSHTLDVQAVNEAFSATLLDDSAYYWLFYKVVADCARFGYLCVPQEVVEFTFDSRLESNHNATEWYAYMQRVEEWPHRSFIADKVSFATRATVGIQVADLVAREGMKHLDNIVGPVQRPKRGAVRALEESKRFGFKFYVGEYFKGMKASLQQMENDSAFPVKFAEYREWLKERGLTDNQSNRIRYFVFVVGRPFGDVAEKG